jgi:glycosyltransferase involved in cell wall biosynthesis
MKIVAVLDAELHNGGGFNQALTAIMQLARLAPGRFDLVTVTPHPANIEILSGHGITALVVRPGPSDRVLSTLADSLVWQACQSHLHYVGGFERKLLNLGADLVYFTSASPLALSLQRLNYVVTVWDISHFDSPEFPEVRSYGEFHRRELFLRNALRPAIGVIVDSQTLADNIANFYGVPRDRILAMPFSPAASVVGGSDDIDICLKHSLRPGFYFYPAQFWPHKNHLRLIDAMHIAGRRRPGLPPLVLCGSDKGGHATMLQRIEKLGLREQVRPIGFVPAADMAALYRTSGAIVMPTYFGPTNLPPLEAWATGRPLIYSAHLAGQAGNAALLVDPDDAESIAEALVKVLDPATAEDLIAKGRIRIGEIDAERRVAEFNLGKLLETFSRRVETWRCLPPASN